MLKCFKLTWYYCQESVSLILRRLTINDDFVYLCVCSNLLMLLLDKTSTKQYWSLVTSARQIGN